MAETEEQNKNGQKIQTRSSVDNTDHLNENVNQQSETELRDQQHGARIGLKKEEFLIGWADAGMKGGPKNNAQSNFSNADKIRNFMKVIKFDDFEKKRMQQFEPNHGLQQLLDDLSTNNMCSSKKLAKLRTMNRAFNGFSTALCTFSCLKDATNAVEGNQIQKIQEEDEEEFEGENNNEFDHQQEMNEIKRDSKTKYQHQLEEQNEKNLRQQKQDISETANYYTISDDDEEKESRFTKGLGKWEWNKEVFIQEQNEKLFRLQAKLEKKRNKQIEAGYYCGSLKFIERRVKSQITDLQKKLRNFEMVEGVVEKRSGSLKSEVNKVKLQIKLVEFKKDQISGEMNEQDHKYFTTLNQKEIIKLEMEKELLDIINQFESFQKREIEVKSILQAQQKELNILEKQQKIKQALKNKQATEMNLVDKINQLIEVKEFCDKISLKEQNQDRSGESSNNSSGGEEGEEEDNGSNNNNENECDRVLSRNQIETQYLMEDDKHQHSLKNKHLIMQRNSFCDEEHDELLLKTKTSPKEENNGHSYQNEDNSNIQEQSMTRLKAASVPKDQQLNQSSFLVQGINCSSTLNHTADTQTPSTFIKKDFPFNSLLSQNVSKKEGPRSSQNATIISGTKKNSKDQTSRQSSNKGHAATVGSQKLQTNLKEDQVNMKNTIVIKKKLESRKSQQNEKDLPLHEKIMHFLDSIKENMSGFFDILIARYKSLQVKLEDWQIKRTMLKQLRDDKFKELKELQAIPIDTTEISLFKKRNQQQQQQIIQQDNVLQEDKKEEVMITNNVEELQDVKEYKKRLESREQERLDEIYKFERTHQYYSLNHLQVTLSFCQQNLKQIHFRFVRSLSNFLDRIVSFSNTLPSLKKPLIQSIPQIEELLLKANSQSSTLNDKANSLFSRDADRLKAELAFPEYSALKFDNSQKQVLADIFCQPGHLFSCLHALLKFFFPFAPGIPQVFINEFKFGFQLLRYCRKSDIIEFVQTVYLATAKSEQFLKMGSDNIHPLLQAKVKHQVNGQAISKLQMKSKTIALQSVSAPITAVDAAQLLKKQKVEDNFQMEKEDDKKELEKVAIFEMFDAFQILIDRSSRQFSSLVSERFNLICNIIRTIKNQQQQFKTYICSIKPDNQETFSSAITAEGINQDNTFTSPLCQNLFSGQQCTGKGAQLLNSESPRNRELLPSLAKYSLPSRYTQFSYGQNLKKDIKTVLPLKVYQNAQVLKLNQQRGFNKYEAKESLLTIDQKEYIMKRRPSIVNIQELVKEHIYILHYQHSPSVINLGEEYANFDDLRDKTKVDISLQEQLERKKRNEELRLQEEEDKKKNVKKKRVMIKSDDSVEDTTNALNPDSLTDVDNKNILIQQEEANAQSHPSTSGNYLAQRLKNVIKLTKTLQAFNFSPQSNQNAAEVTLTQENFNTQSAKEIKPFLKRDNPKLSPIVKTIGSRSPSPLDVNKINQKRQKKDEDKKELIDQMNKIVHYQLDFKKAKENALLRSEEEHQKLGDPSNKKSGHKFSEENSNNQQQTGRPSSTNNTNQGSNNLNNNLNNSNNNNNGVPNQQNKVQTVQTNTNSNNKVIKKGFVSYFRRKQYEQYKQLEEQYSKLFQHSDKYFTQTKQDHLNLIQEDTLFHYLAKENLNSVQEQNHNNQSSSQLTQSQQILQNQQVLTERRESISLKILASKSTFQRQSILESMTPTSAHHFSERSSAQGQDLNLPKNSEKEGVVKTVKHQTFSILNSELQEFPQKLGQKKKGSRESSPRQNMEQQPKNQNLKKISCQSPKQQSYEKRVGQFEPVELPAIYQSDNDHTSRSSSQNGQRKEKNKMQKQNA